MHPQRIDMTALIKAAPGKVAELRSALRSVVASTVKEPGCILFRVFEDLDRPGEFVLWELFEDQHALTEHIQKDYTRDYFASGLAQSTRVRKLREL